MKEDPYDLESYWADLRPKPPKVWRDDKLNPSDSPTAQVVVYCAEDRVYRCENFVLVIGHVRALDGKGFMPSVQSTRHMKVHNGSVAIGQDEKAYDRAIAQGMAILHEEIEQGKHGIV